MTKEISFPAFIDNSAMSSFKRCKRHWYYSSLRKITPKGGNIHLHAGGAYARGLEVARTCYFEKGMDEDDAIAQGLHAFLLFWGDAEIDHETAKDLDRVFYAVIEYFCQYPLGQDVLVPMELPNGKRGIEFSFAVPFDQRHPLTGDPLIFTGRFDLLATYNGAAFGEDDKTATQLGNQWMRNWDLDSQFTGYTYAAKVYGIPLAGFFVRGTSILKNGFGHAQALVYRPQWMLDEWQETTHFTIENMLWHFERQFFPKTLDKHACNSYGGCPFARLCGSPDPEAWVPVYFEPNNWNPLHKE